ncbi:hypothetical protein CK203_052341 [Vitis vinifera]|uniref:Uncharacterized protein n=1 Tax=Vitis vinifera TaxID=29760 RepID=A0A438H2T8_VITVI|nr:hypothetical protein CK203_052341 [Vitis vinifera]
MQENFKPSNQLRQANKGWDSQQQSNQASLTPLSILYEKLLLMIRDLSDFRWPEPIKMDPTKQDRSRRCTYHKDHDHTTEQCRSLHYLVERLIRARHLKQYVHTTGGQRETTRDLVVQALTTTATPRVVINYIHEGPAEDKYNSKWKRQRLLRVAFANGPPIVYLKKPKMATIWVQQSHNNFSKRRCVTRPVGPVTLNVQFSVVEDLSIFNVIMGRAWIHGMKVIPSSYHQMVSCLIEGGQIDLLGSQLAARQCYQVVLDSRHPASDETRPEPSNAKKQ